MRGDKPICAPVARLLPGFNALGLKEPRLVVFGNHMNLEAVRSHPLVQRMKAETGTEYQAGALIRVHTCRSTVWAQQSLEFWATLEHRTAPPGPPVWSPDPLCTS